MTQDTEDVVARLVARAKASQLAFEHGDNAEWQATLKDLEAAEKEIRADRQSLSDRIDVLEGALERIEALESHNPQVATAEDRFTVLNNPANHLIATAKRIARAALHQVSRRDERAKARARRAI